MLANPSYLRYDRPGRRSSGRKTCAFGHTDWSARTRSVKSSSVAGRSFSLYRATSAPSQTNNHPECVAFNEHPDGRWPRKRHVGAVKPCEGFWAYPEWHEESHTFAFSLLPYCSLACAKSIDDVWMPLCNKSQSLIP
jgi:hypothetical protein